MKNVMLDLETYGNTPGSMILSIGAAAFDPTTGEVDDGMYVVVRSGGKAFGLHRDLGTARWWKGQSESARQVIADCKTDDTSTPLPEALDLLDAYVSRFGGKDCKVWGCGADFDNALIRAAYRAVNVDREPVWAFWNNRCYRTLKSFSALEIARGDGTHHNALDDARAQAEHANRILRKLFQ